MQGSYFLFLYRIRSTVYNRWNNPKLSNDVLEIMPDQSETAYFAQLRNDYILDISD